MKITKVESTLVLFLLLLKKVDAQGGILDWIADLMCWIPFVKPAFCNNECDEENSGGKDCGQGGSDPAVGSTGKPPNSINWRTVVNNYRVIPESGDPGRYFNSYNPPSVNANGLVVFRARSTGHTKGPYSGIYMKDEKQGRPTNEIWRVADRNLEAPPPNNLTTTFTEFPSFPRIAPNAATVATRGNHQPVLSYTTADGEESRAGTTGVYVKTANHLLVGAAKLGNVPENVLPQAEYWKVPPSEEAIPFDVFPGAPSITNGMVIAFKGNFNEGGIPKTGVFFRKLTDEVYGGSEPIQLIASSNTEVPNWDNCSGRKGTKFGSTAPPSAHGNTVVFAGFDDEWDPSCGGIYRAPLEPSPDLEALVSIRDPVPTIEGEGLTHVGEGLSYDGHFIAFWGSWGNDSKTVRVFCPTTGNKVRREYCQNTTETDAQGRFYEDEIVPVNQGIFVYDTKLVRLFLVARTGDGENEFDDFIFWKYTGAPPGSGSHGHGGGGNDAEPPRFRSSAFISVNGVKANGVIMFKARLGEQDDYGVYTDPIDGIYYKNGGNNWSGTPSIMVQTGMEGTIFDPEAVIPEGYVETGDPMLVSELGMEREGLRGRYAVITLRFGAEATSLVEEEDSAHSHDTVDEFAGIYIAHVPSG